MVDLNPLISQLNAIDSMLSKTSYSAQSVQEALGELSKLKYTTADPEGLKSIERKIQSLKEYQKQAKDTYESERKSLEQVVGQNKQLLELLDKTILKHETLRKVVLTTAGAYQKFAKEGDLGQAISQMSALLGRFEALGVIFGTVISAATRFQDRIQNINKTVIDASASLGRFREGMAATERQTLALSTGIARYSMFTGVATEELRKHISAASALGFSLSDIGIDETTGEISTLTDAIRKQTGEWGALSTAVGVSRATGLDVQSVMQTMGLQVKTLGDTVEDVAGSFAMLSLAADKSGLSTQILLPLVRNMQEQFKFLGFDTASAVEMLGKAGEVAERAGVTTGQATDVMAKAIGGIANMDFGQMAFFGQQMGMGGGLSAGFQFRQQAGGAGGGDLAAQIGRTIGDLMGGGGELVTEEQARSNEHLAGIRLAQEQFAAQTLGLSQNEARVFINMAGELENLRAMGEGDSQKAKDLEKQLKGMEMGEGEYRRRTLKLSEKIAQMLELISTIVGRLLLTFIRAFVGGAAEDATGGLTGLLKTSMEAINKGEGFDATFGAEGLTGAVDKAFKDVDPVVEKWGKRMGKMFDFFFGSWPGAIASVLGGTIILSAVRRGVTGLFTRAFGGSLLGNLVRGVGGAGGGVAQAAGGAARFFGSGGRLAQAAGATTRTLGASRIAGAFGSLTRTVGGASRGLGGLMRMAGGAGRGLMTMGRAVLGPTGMVVAAGAAGYALGSWIANLEIGEKSVAKHIGDFVASFSKATSAALENASAHNKVAVAAAEASKQLEKQTGVKTETARALFEEKGAGEVLKRFDDDKGTGQKMLEQTAIRLKAVIAAQEQELKISKEAAEAAKGWFGTDEKALSQAETRMTGARITIVKSKEELSSIEKALAAAKNKTQKQDAWDITREGLVYASPGDVLVNAQSMAGVGADGPKGSAKDKLGGGDMGEQAAAIERDVILNVKFMNDLIGQIAEEKIMISVEKDMIAPGKAGKAAMRHGGPSKGYGG